MLLLKNIYEASSLLPALVPRIWQEGEQGRNGESPLVRAFAYAHKQKGVGVGQKSSNVKMQLTKKGVNREKQKEPIFSKARKVHDNV